MKTIVITQPGPPDVLQVQERSRPVAGPGEVLIEVKAAGINRPDVIQRQGYYPAPAGVPADIPGLEVAGVIAETGSGVSRWKKGDLVCALLAGGGYAEYCVAPEGTCLPVPAGLDFTGAASLPETYFTVWNNVFERGRLQTGERFLVQGGTSGIGVAAIQLVAARGGLAYATAGTDEKCRFCEELGALKGIHYKRESFADVILEETGGKGVDVILDMIGGAYLDDHIRILADEGRLVLISTIKGREASVDLLEVRRRGLSITGSTLRTRSVEFKSQLAGRVEKQVWPLLESGKIKPVVYRAFPLEQAGEAHKLMESSQHMGKIMLNV